MFRVDREKKRLFSVETKRFGELNISERSDLQEWIVQSPQALGEDLLIIQKEFDGFKDTKERLDLLALDKEGRLVVIENKLDDSGRDVVWQALKYVAYCSTLKKAELIEIFQRYLNRWDEGADATTKLCEFLEIDDLDDAILNAGNDQRLLLVAAKFRKEVTAAVLWLIGHGIQAQCFRVIPYSFGEELLIDFQQIIPTPDAEDYMIGMVEKETEEKSAQRKKRDIAQLRREFWTQTLERLSALRISRFDNSSTSKENFWLGSATGISSCGLNLIFSKKFVRVELYLSRPRVEDNKWLFDKLESQKQQIENRFGAALYWQRLDRKIASRISVTEQFDGSDRENWPDMIDWLCEHIVKLEKACLAPLLDLKQELESRSSETSDVQSDGTTS